MEHMQVVPDLEHSKEPSQRWVHQGALWLQALFLIQDPST